MNLSFSLSWRTNRKPPTTHYGARTGEHPRYYVRRERRCGTLFWIVYYHRGGLRDIELGCAPRTLREAQRFAEEDLGVRISGGEIPLLRGPISTIALGQPAAACPEKGSSAGDATDDHESASQSFGVVR